ncbi:MAG: outer membrane beta-barrel protein [bacterium]
MKRMLWLTIMMMLLAGSTWAQGIEAGQSEISVGLGYTMPMGDFGDTFDPGLAGCVGFGYYTSPILAIGGEICYNNYGYPSELDVPNVDESYTILQMAGTFKYSLGPDGKGPYLKAIAGFYRFEAEFSDEGVSVSLTETEFGLGAGGGFQFKGNGNMGGFLEATFHNVMTEGDATQFLNLKGGVIFFMGG